MSEERAPPNDRETIHRRPTDLEYERWWRIYKALPPPHSVYRFARVAQINIHRAKHVCRVGWENMPPFEARLESDDAAGREAVRKVAETVEAQAIAAVATIVVGTWEQSVRRHLAPLEDVSRAISDLSRELSLAAADANFVQYRQVPDRDEEGRLRRDERGNVILIPEAYVSGESIVRSAARLASASKDHAMLNKGLLDSLAPFRSSALDFSDAPPETLAYLQKKFGGGRAG